MAGSTEERGKESAHVAVPTDTVTFLDSIAATRNVRSVEELEQIRVRSRSGAYRGDLVARCLLKTHLLDQFLQR
jgi:hypothetical protein